MLMKLYIVGIIYLVTIAILLSIVSFIVETHDRKISQLSLNQLILGNQNILLEEEQQNQFLFLTEENSILRDELESVQAKLDTVDESINGSEKRKIRIAKAISAIKEMLPGGGNPLSGCPSQPSPGELWRIATSIIDYSDEYAVPASLVAAVIRQESVFCNQAVSKAGARGYMQLMPNTAAEVSTDVAVKTGRTLHTWRGKDNIELGTAYLSEMLMEFDGDEKLAVAGYNLGPDNLKRVLAGERKFPVETERYMEIVPQLKLEFEKLGLQ